MINVYQFYKDVLDRINKEENGYLKPDQFNRLLEFSSDELLAYYVGVLNDSTKQDSHQRVYDYLFPFNKRALLPVDGGYVIAPDDYEHFSSLRIRYDDANSYRRLIEINNQMCAAEENFDPTIDVVELESELADLQNEDRYKDVTIYPHDKLSHRLNTDIKAKRPSPTKPIGEYASRSWKVYPNNVASGLLLYYRKPAAASLVMTLNTTTGDIDYNPSASVDIEWPHSAKTALLERIVSDFAISVREPELFQFMDGKSNQNNTKK